eukprot:sb/3476250/
MMKNKLPQVTPTKRTHLLASSKNANEVQYVTVTCNIGDIDTWCGDRTRWLCRQPEEKCCGTTLGDSMCCTGECCRDSSGETVCCPDFAGQVGTINLDTGSGRGDYFCIPVSLPKSPTFL